jgi:hypothetical protein
MYDRVLEMDPHSIAMNTTQSARCMIAVPVESPAITARVPAFAWMGPRMYSRVCSRYNSVHSYYVL